MTPITTRFYYNIGAYIKLHSCFTAYDGRGGDHSWAQAALLIYGKIARDLALNYGAHQQIIAKDAEAVLR